MNPAYACTQLQQVANAAAECNTEPCAKSQNAACRNSTNTTLNVANVVTRSHPLARRVVSAPVFRYSYEKGTPTSTRLASTSGSSLL